VTHDRQRRIFMLHAITGTSVIAAHGSAAAQAAAAASEPAGTVPGPVVNVPVKETDAYPKSMGFKLNTASVDKVKFPRHEPTQKCIDCQLYSGKPGEQLGPCSFFKKLVPPDGWCRNFKPKKAA
jgi:hypothetical protein